MSTDGAIQYNGFCSSRCVELQLSARGCTSLSRSETVRKDQNINILYLQVHKRIRKIF